MDNHVLVDLITPTAPLSPDSLSLRAYEAFSVNPTLYAIAVVDADERPVGLINRFRFLETFSRPFAHDLLKHESVSMLMDRSPLVADEHTPPDQLSQILADEDNRYIFDGFIVTRDGRYLGIGTGHSLMRYLTEVKHAALFHLAHHDPLTGLPNRQLFDDRLTQALALTKRKGEHLGLLYLDVDRLKAVNDGLGHTVGDLLLQSIANRLQGATRTEDTVARLSGDEFAVLLTGLKAPEDAGDVARKLLGVLRVPHVLEGHEVNTSCSIGIAVFPNDASTQIGLLRSADAAVYHAKQFRNTCERYSTEIQAHPGGLPGFAWVRRALDEGHLQVVYQPQILVGSRALCALEALVRWRDPERGLLPTLDLIRLAEDAGLITAVTDFVLGTAMSQMLEWERQGCARGLSLAINVSSVELRDGALFPVLKQHLGSTGFRAQALELEITESTAMLPGTSTEGVLGALKDLGVRLSIDDFGTGYSSLSRLRRLPVDALKIDGTFVEDIELHDGGAMARAIILLAHSLGLTVTGEGVETEAQRMFLELHGCDRMQGYLISHPLAAREMTTYLQAGLSPKIAV